MVITHDTLKKLINLNKIFYNGRSNIYINIIGESVICDIGLGYITMIKHYSLHKVMKDNMCTLKQYKNYIYATNISDVIGEQIIQNATNWTDSYN